MIHNIEICYRDRSKLAVIYTLVSEGNFDKILLLFIYSYHQFSYYYKAAAQKLSSKLESKPLSVVIQFNWSFLFLFIFVLFCFGKFQYQQIEILIEPLLASSNWFLFFFFIFSNGVLIGPLISQQSFSSCRINRVRSHV